MNTQAATATTPDLLEFACEIRESLCDHRRDLLGSCPRLADVRVEAGEMPS